MPRKKKRGGRRNPPGGRPPSDTIRLLITVKYQTAAILTRLAIAKGLVQRRGGKPFHGAAVDDLAATAKTIEPEYERIAREAQEDLRNARPC